MTARGQALLEEQPVWRRQDQVTQAVCNAAGEEFDLLDEAIDTMQRNVIPATAEEFLALFEETLGVSVENPNATVEQRHATVMAYMSRLTMTGSGVDWERVASIFIYSGVWSYEVSGTSHNILNVFLPYPAGSVQANLAEALFRSITPAVMTIQVSQGPGFDLDESPLDEDGLG
jgi:Uncharacterised protein conserved in bacteria (DUF2313)